MSKSIKKIARVATFGLSDAILPSTPETTGSTAAVPTPAATPSVTGEEASAAREAQRRRQLAAAGLGGTMLTGAGGLSGAANTAGKSLLGS
ncbi:hypothetical protein D9M71_638120 [compost metagenome]